MIQTEPWKRVAPWKRVDLANTNVGPVGGSLFNYLVENAQADDPSGKIDEAENMIASMWQLGWSFEVLACPSYEREGAGKDGKWVVWNSGRDGC